MDTKYWLVGASFDSTDHQDKIFIENGYWQLDWTESDQPAQFSKGAQISRGDRIAVKRMKGRGASDISILHIGIVKGVVIGSGRIICIVDWVATNLNRDVESRGCFASVHGPYDKDEWIEKIFCL